MFTGIIEGLGTIDAVYTGAQGARLAVNVSFALEGTRIGDSIAVNGACLTVVSLKGHRFEADVSAETLSKTTFGTIRPGQKVNLERAMRLSDRLDGHLVTGHVDGIAVLEQRKTLGNAIVLSFSTPTELTRFMIKKGSVAVDGISLTINQSNDNGFEISIIPHTAQITTIGSKGVGDRFNIETDIIGKYVERFVTGSRVRDNASSPGIDLETLAKAGFLDR